MPLNERPYGEPMEERARVRRNVPLEASKHVVNLTRRGTFDTNNDLSTDLMKAAPKCLCTDMNFCTTGRQFSAAKWVTALVAQAAVPPAKPQAERTIRAITCLRIETWQLALPMYY
jgi:hypothetical protein